MSVEDSLQPLAHTVTLENQVQGESSTAEAKSIISQSEEACRGSAPKPALIISI